MKKVIALLILSLAISGYAQDQKEAPTLRSILLEELKSTHNEKDWFVDADTAVAGLTAEQANWTDGKGNHSVGQLAYHIVYWNQRNLARFKGETPEKFSGNNDETFTQFDSKKWADTVRQLDAVMTEWEKAVETMDDKKLEEWAPVLSRIATHNAYHIGQIVFVRKEQGSWDASKGVK
ncbi:MAG TPA: DinB family protein [Candidatus Acidoferrales bacterium]|nr:DinB family protein [Candidatus Acidoferrales bacterium]